jgi:hypothetical protein
MKLTPQQFDLIKNFWKKGRFRIEDMGVAYTSTSSKIECINRLMSLGIIEQEIDTDFFKINREKYIDYEDD